MKIRTEDFILQTSKKGNHYIVNDKGENIMVPASVAKQWDSLDEVTLGERKFTKQTNPDTGELEDKEWSRIEVVGKKDINVTVEKKAKQFEAKTRLLTAASQYETAKKSALKEAGLSAETTKELEALLSF